MCDNRIGYGYAGLLNEDDGTERTNQKKKETWNTLALPKKKNGICLKAADNAKTGMPTQMMAFHSEFSAMSRWKGTATPATV